MARIESTRGFYLSSTLFGGGLRLYRDNHETCDPGSRRTYSVSCSRQRKSHYCLASSVVRLPQASEILEASMEAGLTLREVEDTVFSSTRTLEFFNSADLKQVYELRRYHIPKCDGLV